MELMTEDAIQMNPEIFVDSEIAPLKRVFIHTPDDGIGKIFPSRAQEWLYDDIIDLEMMRNEYELLTKILLCFLDKDTFRKSINNEVNLRDPKSSNFFHSHQVIDLQWLLSDILNIEKVRDYVVSAVCANESVHYSTFKQLLTLDSRTLANTLISGCLPTGKWIFPPISNFTMVRDVLVVVKNCVVLCRLSKMARKRESIFLRFIVHNHPIFQQNCKIIDIEEDELRFLLDEKNRERCKITLEGGDFLIASPEHLLIGISERTTIDAARSLIKILHNNDIVKKVTLIHIPNQRYCMHLDTLITQVKKNMWIIFSALCKKGIEQSSFNSIIKQDLEIKIEQHVKGDTKTRHFDCLEDLLEDISHNDLKYDGPVEFVQSGGGRFPDSWREQWSDGCNSLALREGVLIMYDRNRQTVKALEEKGMHVIPAAEFIEKVQKNTIDTTTIKDTVILLPSAELTRARGGPHCLTHPMLREKIVM